MCILFESHISGRWCVQGEKEISESKEEVCQVSACFTAQPKVTYIGSENRISN